MWTVLKNFWDNTKHTNICIKGIPEEKRENKQTQNISSKKSPTYIKKLLKKRTNKTKSWLFEKINKMDKTVASLKKRQKETK